MQFAVPDEKCLALEAQLGACCQSDMMFCLTVRWDQFEGTTLQTCVGLTD